MSPERSDDERTDALAAEDSGEGADGERGGTLGERGGTLGERGGTLGERDGDDDGDPADSPEFRAHRHRELTERARAHWTERRLAELARGKALLLPPVEAAPLLRTIGLLHRDASMPPRQVRKYWQVSHMVTLLGSALRALIAEHGTVRILDAGCGRSYLSLALAWVAEHRWGGRVQILGVDRNPDVVAECQRRARFAQLDHALRFRAEELGSLDLEAAWREAAFPDRDLAPASVPDLDHDSDPDPVPDPVSVPDRDSDPDPDPDPDPDRDSDRDSVRDSVPVPVLVPGKRGLEAAWREAAFPDSDRDLAPASVLEPDAGRAAIAPYPAPFSLHALLSLHACDTATCDALALGVRLGASLIAVAPCCQAELARGWAALDASIPGGPDHTSHSIDNDLQRPAAVSPFRAIWGMPHLRRETGADLTDAMRALLLRACGYQVSAIEFVPSEHTRKNTLLKAMTPPRRTTTAERAEALAEYRALVSATGGVGLGLAGRLALPPT